MWWHASHIPQGKLLPSIGLCSSGHLLPSRSPESGGAEGAFPRGPGVGSLATWGTVDPFMVWEDVTGHGAAEAMLDNDRVVLHNTHSEKATHCN